MSATFVDEVPVDRSSVPLAAALHVFRTHTLRLGKTVFGTGSGVPKLQPTPVQSGPATLTAGAVDVGPIVQPGPQQLIENRLIEPSGVGPSGMMEAPPPMSRPPQVRLFMVAPEPSCVVPQVPPAADSVKSRVPFRTCPGSQVLQVQSAVQNPHSPPTGPPVDDPESHSSPGSTWWSPHRGGAVVVVVSVGPTMLVVLVVVVVVVAQEPCWVQPAPTLVGAVAVHTWPLHFPAFTTLLMSCPFLFASQQTTKPLRPQVEFCTNRFVNCFLHAPVSIEPTACLACLTYFPCLLALAHGTLASTDSSTAAKREVSAHFLPAWTGGAVARRASRASRATRQRSVSPILCSFVVCCCGLAAHEGVDWRARHPVPSSSITCRRADCQAVRRLRVRPSVTSERGECDTVAPCRPAGKNQS